MVTELGSPIGFSDSELQSYLRIGETLNVRIKTWNDRILLVNFVGVLGVKDLLSGSFSAVQIGAIESIPFLEQTLECMYVELPQMHIYQVYSFLNHDDKPALEVVASGCDVTVEIN